MKVEIFLITHSYINKFIAKPSTCLNADRRKSFSKMGWSRCQEQNLFITAFYRITNLALEMASVNFRRQDVAVPQIQFQAFSGQEDVCKTTDWRNSMDTYYVYIGCEIPFKINRESPMYRAYSESSNISVVATLQ